MAFTAFPPLDGEGGAQATGGVVPPPFAQNQSGSSTLAATSPHPSLRATLPTRGREDMMGGRL